MVYGGAKSTSLSLTDRQPDSLLPLFSRVDADSDGCRVVARDVQRPPSCTRRATTDLPEVAKTCRGPHSPTRSPSKTSECSEKQRGHDSIPPHVLFLLHTAGFLAKIRRNLRGKAINVEKIGIWEFGETVWP